MLYELHSKKVRVGLSSAFGAGIHPTLGNTIYQQGSNVTGNLVGTAGAASGSLTVTRRYWIYIIKRICCLS